MTRMESAKINIKISILLIIYRTYARLNGSFFTSYVKTRYENTDPPRKSCGPFKLA